MKKINLTIFLLALIIFIIVPFALFAQKTKSSTRPSKTATAPSKTVKVRSYTKQDGTKVKTHTRSKPKKGSKSHFLPTRRLAY